MTEEPEDDETVPAWLEYLEWTQVNIYHESD